MCSTLWALIPILTPQATSGRFGEVAVTLCTLERTERESIGTIVEAERNNKP